MAKAVSARQFGDEYQQLVFWKYALKMLSGNYEIANIKYEDENVKSYDDVVIEYEKPQIFRNTVITTEYIQVKFHMRDEDLFTLDNLLDPAFINATKNSLLDNVVTAYRQLGDKFRNCVFVIYSMWDIAQGDILYELVSNVNRTIDIDKLFMGKTEQSQMGKIRKKLCTRLAVNELELKEILGQICIKSRQETLNDLKHVLNQKLEMMGLQVISGSKHINPYSQLIQKLNMSGHTVFTKGFLENQLHNEGLYLIKKEQALIAIRSFIKHAENLETKAEYILKLEEYFTGRFLKEEYQWEDTIYSRLKEFLVTNCQEDKEYNILIEANPTIAFLAGRILDIKTSKNIVPVQRTDNGIVKWERKDNDIQYPQAICTSKTLDEGNDNVAVVISISRDILDDVEEYLLAEQLGVGRIVDVRLKTVDSANVIDGMHAWCLANQIKNVIDKRLLREKKGILHMFFACPNSMLFILARYSLSFGKIQLYEYDFNKQRTCTYYPTMTLPVKEEF